MPTPKQSRKQELARLLTRRVSFLFAGKSWPLLFTYRVLLEVQEMTGQDLISETMSNPSASLIRALLFAALLQAGAKTTAEDVGKSVMKIGIPTARKLVGEAWDAAMPQPEPKAKTEETTERTGWVDLWASAREWHGLKSQEWLDLTPRMLHALEKARLDQMRYQELLTAQLCACVVNFSFCRPDTPISPEEFLLHKFPAKKEKVQGPVTGEMIMAALKPKMIRRRA